MAISSTIFDAQEEDSSKQSLGNELTQPVRHPNMMIARNLFPLRSHSDGRGEGQGEVRVSEEVILLHGLCRTSRSMDKMAHALTAAGFKVRNINYPSRSAPIAKLADDTIGNAVAECNADGATKIDFVTHSLGGILVRSYLACHSIPNLGRVVMLAPPNQGSEVVDKLGGWPIFKWINGPAGNELGTDSNSVPNQLGPANFPVGIIAGDRSINWINSLLIHGPDDGKVSVQRAKLAGMSDFIVLHTTHPFIMRNHEVISQTIQFLKTGKFER